VVAISAPVPPVIDDSNPSKNDVEDEPTYPLVYPEAQTG
jgi:hypothetical protein